MRIMQSAGIEAGVVQTIRDIYDDPQLKYYHHFVELEHAAMGKHLYENTGFSLSKTPGEFRMAAPCLGQHNEYVCTQLLDISDMEFVDLYEAGVFK